MLNHPTGLFSGDYNSALRGCWPSNVYTFYNSLKCFSSRTWGTGRPHVGLCPIFLSSFCFTRFLISHRISELRPPIDAKHCTVISICVIFLMSINYGSHPKIFTPAKFLFDSTQFSTLIADISGTRQDIKYRKDMWSRTIPSAFVERDPVNFGPLSTK